jgi:hypothetical protein
MIEERIKCEPEILFKITKKDADFVLKLPGFLQDEFEDYQKLKYKFHCLSKLIYSKVDIRTNFFEKRDINSTISSGCALLD